MASRNPNLFVVGAMRAGTTTLHELLGRHPSIFMSSIKEPAYFVARDQLSIDSPAASRMGFSENRTRYLELFAGSSGERYLGESSTHYTKQPRLTGVAERMAAFAPDARIIYLVRDPVHRTLSHYRFAVRMKYERRPLLQALEADPHYCDVSNYAMQIRPYLECFGPDRVQILALEDLRKAPQVELDRLTDWLELPRLDHGESHLPQLNQVGPTVSRKRGPEFFHKLGQSPRYQQVATRYLPNAVRTSARKVLNRRVSAGDLNDPAAMRYLHEVHGGHVESFEELTGHTYPQWKTGPA